MFWREQRLEPQLELARRNGYRIDIGRVCDLLDGHEPLRRSCTATCGAAMRDSARRENAGSPVLFDPAVYYGDREVDLAMTELFGGFPAEFYSA